jgi:hypothetical protein
MLAIPCLLRRTISSRLFQDVFVGSGKRFRPGKMRRRYRRSGAARRAVKWTAPTSHFAMPLTPNKTKGGSQLAGLEQKSFTGE